MTLPAALPSTVRGQGSVEFTVSGASQLYLGIMALQSGTTTFCSRTWTSAQVSAESRFIVSRKLFSVAELPWWTHQFPRQELHPQRLRPSTMGGL